ncbi:hypothetical protein MHB42_09255 [Lysinibacillus sp. FSL K6-0232]|uniref:hypothetical protein n=1 Tax=unclassified Lysinibacillus TaxID=2636778 RepID=UPI0030FAC996
MADIEQALHLLKQRQYQLELDIQQLEYKIKRAFHHKKDINPIEYLYRSELKVALREKLNKERLYTN